MPNFNKVIIAGHLGADPEVRAVGSTTLAKMRLALDDSYKNKDGEKVERTVWIDVDAWGYQADYAAKYLKKGAAVLVDGKLQMDAWDAAETGEKRRKHFIRADRLVGMSGKQSQSSEPAHDDTPPAAEPAKGAEEIPF